MLRSSERRSMFVFEERVKFDRFPSDFHSFQDEANVYLLLEFLDGGSTKFFDARRSFVLREFELFRHLQRFDRSYAD